MLSELTPREPNQEHVVHGVRRRRDNEFLLSASLVLLVLMSLVAGFFAVAYWMVSEQRGQVRQELSEAREELSGAEAELDKLKRGANRVIGLKKPSQAEAEMVGENEGMAEMVEGVKDNAAGGKWFESPEHVEAAMARASKVDDFANQGYESTNLKVQQAALLGLEDGRLQKVLLEIPVLYRSRQLRLDKELIGELHGLREELAIYQSKVREVRSEGDQLLNKWEIFLAKALPVAALRADSLSLPASHSLKYATQTGEPRREDDLKTVKDDK